MYLRKGGDWVTFSLWIIFMYAQLLPAHKVGRGMRKIHFLFFCSGFTPKEMLHFLSSHTLVLGHLSFILARFEMALELGRILQPQLSSQQLRGIHYVPKWPHLPFSLLKSRPVQEEGISHFTQSAYILPHRCSLILWAGDLG